MFTAPLFVFSGHIRICRPTSVSLSAPEADSCASYRPADQGGLDDGELEGLPAETASCSGLAGHLYFVIATAEPPVADCAASLGMYSPVQVLPTFPSALRQEARVIPSLLSHSIKSISVDEPSCPPV